jgi:hypothetical protein
MTEKIKYIPCNDAERTYHFMMDGMRFSETFTDVVAEDEEYPGNIKLADGRCVELIPAWFGMTRLKRETATIVTLNVVTVTKGDSPAPEQPGDGSGASILG